MSFCSQGGARSLSRVVSVQGVSVQGDLCPGGSLSREVSVQGSLCPGGSLSGEESLSRGSLSGGGISVQGVPVQGRSLSRVVSVQRARGLCPRRVLCPGGLCQGDLLVQ